MQKCEKCQPIHSKNNCNKVVWRKRKTRFLLLFKRASACIISHPHSFPANCQHFFWSCKCFFHSGFDTRGEGRSHPTRAKAKRFEIFEIYGFIKSREWRQSSHFLKQFLPSSFLLWILSDWISSSFFPPFSFRACGMLWRKLRKLGSIFEMVSCLKRCQQLA